MEKKKTQSGLMRETASRPDDRWRNLVGKMNEPLKDACEEIQKVLDDLGNVDIRARHKVGTIVAGVEADKGKYGTKAIAKIAEVLDYSTNRLYEAAVVADTWPESQITKLIDQQNSIRGHNLTWSHLVTLSTLNDDCLRTSLIDRIRSEGLTVRELAKEIKGGDPAADEEDARTMMVSQVLRRMKAEVETVVAKAEHWRELFANARKVNGSDSGTAGMLKLREEVAELLIQVMQVRQAQLAMIRECVDPTEIRAAADGTVGAAGTA